jgi:adenylate cyclase
MTNVQSVSELAWAGKHAEAIERATELLSASGLGVPERVQLLDLRSESHLADPAGSAVEAAKEMIELVDLFNREPAAASKPEIRIGIGIATGDVVAGYTGTQQRATYTCVGDTVNLAARLEAKTRDAERAILIDAATRDRLTADLAIEALGPMPIKGKAAPVEVFAVRTP